ncbi:MAG: ABC transporter permease [Deltaproteobacteria bacterium]|nr:ABC transporter permease [Deltaproteobacteria bacterium]
MPAPSEHRHTRAWILVIVGALLVIAGVVITVTSFEKGQEASGNTYVIAFGPVIAGLGIAMRGVSELAGYRSYVAWRYLLVAHPKVTRTGKVVIGATLLASVILRIFAGGDLAMIAQTVTAPFDDTLATLLLVAVLANIAAVFWFVIRHSKPAMVGFLAGLVVALASIGLTRLVMLNKLPFVTLGSDLQLTLLQIFGVSALVGWIIVGLCAFFGSLRAFFTFFTTVPIGGVWIGTSALVCVLSVMSGFETDLRQKILGSNAHIQVTREDGEFVEWREVKQKIDNLSGVVASTPYAVSEVVIAAHNNGMNVIIKGIDPKTVGTVTDLISDLEDREAMTRLEPLVNDETDRSIPQKPHAKDAVDPPPPDMPNGGDPIDFSGSDSGSGSGAVLEPPPALDDKPIDPPPPDLVVADDPPRDFSARDQEDDEDISDHLPISVIDIEPSVSRRTQSLPGILVGRELVKQTHLYTGEEVRVVSPLSDPSNPDATGTPIPFNRDYRVAGIFYTGMYEYDLKYVYVTLDSLQDFLDRGDAVDGIEIRIDDPDDTERYMGTDGLIAEAIGPGYRVVDWRELNRSLFSALKLEKIAMFLVLGIVILVASFSIVGNLIMVVVEKAREIALLKTLGASDVGVMQLFAIQGLMIGLIGTALGIATGLAACWAGKVYGLPLNPDVYYIDRLPIHVDPQSVAAAAAAGILISIAATLYPALLAARVRPAAGMRH